jgi:hypothetical protein
MELKIGVQHAQRELVVETDDTAEAVEKRLAEAIEAGGAFSVTDTKGRRVIVPADKVAYIEIGSTVVGTVGFR